MWNEWETLGGTEMTDPKEMAQAILDASMSSRGGKFRVIATLREVINQLQQSPGVISCADVLELCEEIEKL